MGTFHHIWLISTVCTCFILTKKTTDIPIAHVVVQLFLMPLFSIMSTLKYQQNFTAEHVGTGHAPDLDFARHEKQHNHRFTCGCRIWTVQSTPPKKIGPTVGARPQPCKVEVNKRKQQAPNQRESTNRPNCSPTAPKRKPEPNKQNQQPMNQQEPLIQ